MQSVSGYLLLFFLALFGCTQGTPNRNSTQEEQATPPNNKTPVNSQEEKVYNSQPSPIYFSGVIVDPKTKLLDSRIKVILQAGVNNRGERPEVKTQDLLHLNPKYSDPLNGRSSSPADYFAIADQNLVGKITVIGDCDEALINRIAKLKSLRVERLDQPNDSDSLHILANTVLLCGSPKWLNLPGITITAIDLYLSSFDMSFDLQGVFLDWSVNKMNLLGNNRIASIAPNSNDVNNPQRGIMIVINVFEALVSENSGSLSVSAYGSDYKN